MRPFLLVFRFALPFGVVAAAAVLLAAPVAAQPYDSTLVLRAPHRADAATLPLREALGLALRAELANGDTRYVLARARWSGDSTLRPLLRRIAFAYARTSYRVFARQALQAILDLGESPDALIALALAEADSMPYLAEYAAETAATRADSAGWHRLSPLGHYPCPAACGLLQYRAVLQDARTLYAMPIEEQARRLANAAALTYHVPPPDDPSFHPYAGPAMGDVELDPRIGWAVEQLARLGRIRPDLVRAAIAERSAERTAHAPQYGEAVEAEVLRYARLPAEAERAPIDPEAEVVPFVECVREEDEAGGFVAYFGYENVEGSRATVLYGSDNVVTPGSYDGRQPETFEVPGLVADAPGRTPPFPGHAFTVPFRPGASVVWTLGGHTAVASPDSPRCPQP